MPLNLESARRKVEELMEDVVLIDRKPRDADRTFNETTGQYDTPEDSPLYEGPAMISTNAQEPRDRPTGGTNVDDTLYFLRIPSDIHMPRLRRDDRVVVMRSDRSPQFEGLEFHIIQQIAGTFSVSARFQMTLRDRVID